MKRNNKAVFSRILFSHNKEKEEENSSSSSDSENESENESSDEEEICNCLKKCSSSIDCSIYLTESECEEDSEHEKCSGGCTRSKGYWKNHEELWITYNNLLLCNITFQNIMKEKPKSGNSWLKLAQQYITSILNINILKACQTDNILTLINSAFNLLISNCNNNNSEIPYISPNSQIGQEMNSLKSHLENFNIGCSGPGHCCDNSSSEDTNEDSEEEDK